MPYVVRKDALRHNMMTRICEERSGLSTAFSLSARSGASGPPEYPCAVLYATSSGRVTTFLQALPISGSGYLVASGSVTAGAITRVPLARTGLTKPFRPNAGAPDSARPRDNRL